MCLKKNNELTDKYKQENAGKTLKGYKILKLNADGWESPFYKQTYQIGENRAETRHKSYIQSEHLVDIGLHLFTTLAGVYRSFQFIDALKEMWGYNSYNVGREQSCYIVEVEYLVDDLTAVGVWNDYLVDSNVDSLSKVFVSNYPDDQVVVTKCYISETAFENAIKVE